MALQKEILSVGTSDIEHYLLCNDVPMTVGKDELSRSLLRFKSRLEVDLTAWVECSVSVLEPLLSSDFIIVRALSHEEEIATYSALDHIGVKIADELHCLDQPQSLRKRNLSPPLKTLNRADRIKAMKNVYDFVDAVKKSKNNYLIIDDILTTGTTPRGIVNAIIDVQPESRIMIFTLGKVDYTLQMNEETAFEGEALSLGRTFLGTP